MSKKIYKAVIYCRLSKEDSDKVESNSISNQKMYCEDFAKKQKDIKLAREPIVDDGVSGVSLERTGFNELKVEIEKGNVNCVIVRDLSRFSRNYIDAGLYLEKIFPSLGVRFIAINDNYDSLTSDSASDSYILPFKNLINDSYCKDISIKIRSSLDTKRKNGEFVGSFCPYGYKKSDENKNQLVVDENVRDNINLIFTSYKDGMSITQIADKLNEIGVLSPLEYKKSVGINYDTVFKTSKVAKWEYKSVQRVLTNEIYTGTLIQGKQTTPNYKVKVQQLKDESQWIRVENAHQSLISTEDFQAIQLMMNRDMRTTTKDKNGKNLLSGFVFCGDCGATMLRQVINSKNKQYIYYNCSDYANHKKCYSHSINGADLEKNILDILKYQIENICNLEKLVRITKELPIEKQKSFSYENQIMKLKEEIEEHTKMKMRLYVDYTNDILTKNEYLNYKEDYDINIENKENIINKLENEENQNLDIESLTKSWVKFFREHENIEELNRRVLMALIYKIKVYDKNRVEIMFKYSNEYEKTINYLNNLNSNSVKDIIEGNIIENIIVEHCAVGE